MGRYTLNITIYHLLMAVVQAAENVSLLQVSLDKGFVVGGSSAGANLAAAVALRARDDPFFKDKPLTGQVLEIPATIHPLGYPDKCETF